ncbi:Na+/H+ antiporter subunit E [Sphingomonas faeni]|uniref:Na+/H+ antiporter subunit E n=1 Tax=Sphingomonas faeni TaxID=185950 RepID=UPI00277D6C56|nr:Na+/H+ antiporter subunit E [Sphingomonas faeni]MDQ0839994.1 multicomponent K+:H+ antiporter subunit E [Sphingomonas faeni]
MKRLFPYPLLTLSLLAMWLLLNRSVSPGHLLLGSMVAVGASLAMRALGNESPQIRSWRPLPRILLLLTTDVLRSNIAVARIILSPVQRDGTSGFIRISLRTRNRHAQTFLAIMMTATPGTLWVQFDRVTGILLVHILDQVGADGWTRRIQTRYEPLLLEMFG